MNQLRIYIIGFFYILQLMGSEIALSFSYDWVAGGDFLSETQKKEWKKKYPVLRDAQDIQALLKDISSQSMLRSLSISVYEGKLFLLGQQGKRISKIEVHSTLHEFQSISYLINKMFSQEMDSEKTRSAIALQISQVLRKKGYPHGTSSIVTKSDRQSIEYHITIEEGPPCRIQQMHFPDEQKEKFQWAWKKGDICNIDALKEKISDQKESLRKKGFSLIYLELDHIDYMKDGYAANVYIKGSLGPQYRYSIREEDSNVVLDFLRIQSIKVDSLAQDFATVESDIFRYYKELGYAEIQINETIQEKKEDGSILTTFVVNKGVQYIIHSVDFHGNRNIRSDLLLEKTGASTLLSKRPALHDAEVEKWKENIRSYYAEMGYWDVKVQEPRMVKEKKTGAAHLSFSIEEGPRYLLKKLFLSGNHSIPEWEILDKIPIPIGDFLAKSAMTKVKESLGALYISRGYLYFDVKEFFSLQSRKNQVEVFVTLHLAEGVQVRVGKISIKGLEKTKEKVVRRKLLFSSGEFFTYNQLAKSRSALMNLGIFHSVQITPNSVQQANLDPVIDIDIQLIEGNAGTFSFGPGYNLYSGFSYIAETAYNNLWGTGRRVSFRAGISEEKHQQDINDVNGTKGQTLLGRRVGVGYVEPNVADFPMDFLLSLSHRATADDIWQLSNILEPSLHYPFQNVPYSWIDVFYRLRYESDKGSELQEDLLVLTGETRVAAVGVRLQTDTRNNKSWPTSGIFLSSEAQLSRYLLYSQYRFERYNFQSSHYLSLFSDWVLAYGMNLTVYQNINRTGEDPDILPSVDRLQPGGSDYVRGFEKQLGPYVRNATNTETDILGGSQSVVLKTELRYQISPNRFGAAIFMDLGNTFFTEKELDDFNDFYAKQAAPPVLEDNHRYSVSSLLENPKELYQQNYAASGIALKLLTPLGSVNAAIAWPIHEPNSTSCEQKGICLPRANQSERWISRCKLELNIGAEF